MKSKLLITSMLLISTSVYAQPPTPSAGNTSTINKPTSLQQAKSQAQAAKPQAQTAKSQAQAQAAKSLVKVQAAKSLAQSEAQAPESQHNEYTVHIYSN